MHRESQGISGEEVAEVIAGDAAYDVGVAFADRRVALLLVPRDAALEPLRLELTLQNAQRLASELELVAGSFGAAPEEPPGFPEGAGH